MIFLKYKPSDDDLTNPKKFLDLKASGINSKHQEIKKFALNLQLQTIQILTNNVQVLILCLSYFIIAVTNL